MPKRSVACRFMYEWSIKGRRFHIREAQSEEDYHAVEALQKEVWSFSDLDIVPAATLIATQHAGGTALCSFEGDRMIGFAYAFPAFERGRSSMHSHMLAVRADCRNLQVGFFLKLAQRERTLELGLNEITWTFDPLQSLNAHLNFSKLGVISRRYAVNFYGEQTSSPLHQGFGTDRLWVNWLLDSERVKQLVEQGQSLHKAEGFVSSSATISGLSCIVRAEGDHPQLDGLASGLSADRCLIEIPQNITALKQRDPAAARAWREATRTAFQAALDTNFLIENFIRQPEENRPRYFYLLTRAAP